MYELAPHTLVFNDLGPWFSRLRRYFSREITAFFMKPLLTDIGSRFSENDLWCPLDSWKDHIEK